MKINAAVQFSYLVHELRTNSLVIYFMKPFFYEINSFNYANERTELNQPSAPNLYCPGPSTFTTRLWISYSSENMLSRCFNFTDDNADQG